MVDILKGLTHKAIDGKGIDKKEAMILARLSSEHILSLCEAANNIRMKRFGNTLHTCAIVNAKSGFCSEDCRFCAQSIHYKTAINTYPLITPQEILKAGKEAEKKGATHFSIVTSGRGAGLKKNREEFFKIIEAIELLYKETHLKVDASLGILTAEEAGLLVGAGVYYYHHNLETSRGFYNKIATTHSFDDRINTIIIAQKAGMKICSGGIIGLGESMEDRIDMAIQLRELKVKSVPINILTPILGTPMQDAPGLQRHIILQTMAILRFILPDTIMRLAAGRERGMEEIDKAFLSGLNGIMLGDFLTTTGNKSTDDLRTLHDLGFDVPGQ